jgi:hypothetical protein
LTSIKRATLLKTSKTILTFSVITFAQYSPSSIIFHKNANYIYDSGPSCSHDAFKH